MSTPTTAGAGGTVGAPNAREEILGRIRRAVAGVPGAPGTRAGSASGIPRGYLDAHVHEGLAALLAENLADYRAHVHHARSDAEVATLVAGLLAGPRLVAPDGLPESWIPRSAEPLRDDPPLTPAALDAVDAVLTGCALAIAETGTIVLDAGPGQGRRVLTLIPDHHICVIRADDQIVASLPHAVARLDPSRPQTWIAGPSATSDIELDRVEGVHGPRRLDVILVGGDWPGTESEG